MSAPDPARDSQPLPRVGVVGTGHIGRNHARLLAELSGAQFTAIFDANTATAQEMARHPGGRGGPSLEASPGAVEAAPIATPPPSLFEIAKFLRGRGKLALIEKPIRETTADARALAALAT